MKQSEVQVPMHIARGALTRKRVLELAVQVATSEGLEALTIGRLAQAADITKAGLLGHFGSKEALQLATIQAGRDGFVARIVEPAKGARAGVPRLLALVDGWIDYVAKSKGGCFFASVSAEFDGRSGPVHEAIAQMMSSWLEYLRAVLEEGRAEQQIRRSADTEQLLLTLLGLVLALNMRRQLLDDTHVALLARRTARNVLRQSTTPTGTRLIREQR